MSLPRKAVALVAGFASVLCLPAAANAEPDPHIAHLRGSALVVFPPSPDDIVRFTVDAHARHDDPGPYPTDSWGTASVRHWFAAVDKEIAYSVEVDCLVAAGGQATVTGKVVEASPGGEMLLHTRVGFSVAERGRRDLVGYTGGPSIYPGDATELRMCMAPPPFFTTREGGYQVKGAMRW